jgi:hypothetical protein
MKSKIDPDFFIRPDIENLSHEIRFAAVWLMAQRCVNMVGYSVITEKRFVYETALPKEVLGEALRVLPKLFVALGEGYWCRTYIRDQFGPSETLMRNNMCHALVRHMAECPDEVIEMILHEYPELEELWEKRVLPQPLGSTKSKSKRKRRSKNSVVGSAREPSEDEGATDIDPPTELEVRQYAETIGLDKITTDEFWDTYSTNGWKDKAGDKIKNWKLKARSWLRNDQKRGRKNSLTKGGAGSTDTAFDPKIPHAHTGGIPVAN